MRSVYKSIVIPGSVGVGPCISNPKHLFIQIVVYIIPAQRVQSYARVCASSPSCDDFGMWSQDETFGKTGE